MSKRKSEFHNSIQNIFNQKNSENNYVRLFQLFSNIALNRFKWENLPHGIESRYIEKALFDYGQAGFVDDDTLGLICLPVMETANINVYGEAVEYQMQGINYSKRYNIDEFVRIINNDKCIPSVWHVSYYAQKIAEVDKAMDINLSHQKTPYIVATSKQNELSMKNLIKRIQEDDYAIYVDEKLSQGGDIGISVENTLAPYLIEQLQDHKNNLTDEFLTLMGLNNKNAESKKERLLVDEVNVNNGQILMYLDLDYKNRQIACEEINKRYGLNVKITKIIDDLEIDFIGQVGNNGEMAEGREE